VGIGTTSPSQKLDVNGNVRIRGSILGGSTERLDIYQNTTAANSASWIEMWGMDGSNRQGELALAGNYISFRTGSNESSAGTEQMSLRGSDLTVMGIVKSNGMSSSGNVTVTNGDILVSAINKGIQFAGGGRITQNSTTDSWIRFSKSIYANSNTIRTDGTLHV